MRVREARALLLIPCVRGPAPRRSLVCAFQGEEASSPPALAARVLGSRSVSSKFARVPSHFSGCASASVFPQRQLIGPGLA